MLREAEPNFNVGDRTLFLQICGIRQLSICVKSEPLTESLRPCPSMQAMVRTVVPYIQRFLCNHDELSGVYSELVKNNIKEKIKRLYFGQVKSLQFAQKRSIVYTQVSLNGKVPSYPFITLLCLFTGGKAVHPL